MLRRISAGRDRKMLLRESFSWPRPFCECFPELVEASKVRDASVPSDVLIFIKKKEETQQRTDSSTDEETNRQCHN